MIVQAHIVLTVDEAVVEIEKDFTVINTLYHFSGQDLDEFLHVYFFNKYSDDLRELLDMADDISGSFKIVDAQNGT